MSTKQSVLGWLLPLLAFFVLVVGAVTADAYDISGTIHNNDTNSTSQVYLVVMWSGGGSTGYGTSLPSIPAGGSADFTIHGVPSGYYKLLAFSDTDNTGSLHVNDPYVISSDVNINSNPGPGSPTGTSPSGTTTTNSPVNVGTLSLSAAGSTAPQALDNLMVLPTGDGALVTWDNPGVQLLGGVQAEYADSYVLYWGTSPNPGNGSDPLGSKTVAASGEYHVILSGIPEGSVLYFGVQAVNAAGSTYFSTANPTTIAAATGNATVSGRVYFANNVDYSSHPLYIALQGRKGFSVTKVTPTGNPTSWTISGVQPDTYSVFTILDLNNDGFSSVAGYVTGFGMHGSRTAPSFSVLDGAATATAPDITLTAGNSVTSLTTQTSNSFGNYWYNLQFSTSPGLKRPVSATVNGGPNLSGAIDLGLSLNNGGQFGDNGGLPIPGKPSVGDSYQVAVTYADGSSETVNTAVTGVIGSLPAQFFPVGSTTAIDGNSLFAWRTPGQPPAGYYDYSVWVNDSNYNQIWGTNDKSSNLPANQTWVPFNSDGSAWLQTLAGGSGTYTWTTNIRDGFGNQGQMQNTFTPMAGGPSISSFSPGGGKAGNSVTITGSGFTGATSVKIAGTTASFTVNSDTQITATVPANAPAGPVTVTVGGITGASSAPFQTKIVFSGTVQDAAGNPISGANVTVEGSSPAVSTSTDANGNFSLGGILSALPYSIRISQQGFRDTLTAVYTNNANTTSSGPFRLSTDNDLPFSVADKGLIQSSVRDWDAGSAITGATVTANSFLHPETPYTVYYTDATGAPTIVGTTGPDGKFLVPNLDEGDIVTVTASASGYASQVRTFLTHIGVVSQTRVNATPVPVITANPPGGTISSTQPVALTVSNTVTGDTYSIFYTTDGSDPTTSTTRTVIHGLTANVQLKPGNATLKFYAMNEMHNIAVSSVATANYNVTGLASAVAVTLIPAAPGSGPQASATVTPADATGSIQFFVDGTAFGAPVTLAGGSASTMLYVSSDSAHVISASYSGDWTYLPSTSIDNPTLKVGTWTNINSSVNPSNYGQGVSFTANVSSANATGTVQFQIDGVNFGDPVALVAGSATSGVTSALNSGSHMVTAVYSGDTNFSGSTSFPWYQNVNGITPGITVTPSANPVPFGQSASFTATLLPSNATGNVQFFVDGMLVGPLVPVVNGSAASGLVGNLGPGSHNVSANYFPDTASSLNFYSSNSGPVGFSMLPPPPVASIFVPASVATGTFTLTWTAMGAGTTYELDYSADGGNTWIPAYMGANAWQDFFQFPNGTYLFRVKAIYGAASSGWTTTGSFTVTESLSTPGVPVATSSSNITSGTFTLTWRPTGLAGSTYELDYSPDGGATWIQAYNGLNPYCDFFQFPNGSYLFRVKAMNGGASSGWATTGSLTITQSLSTPGVPVATSSSSVTSGTFTLTWKPTGLAGSTYELDYSADGGSTWTQAYNGPNTYRDFFQLPNGTYIFRVKAINGGASSGWATMAAFTVTQSLSAPGVPVATSSSSVTSGTFTLTWKPTGLAGSTYELDYSTDGGATWTQAYSGANTWQDFYQLANGAYIFRVKAMNAGASSAWATTGSFTVTQSLSAPGVPAPTSSSSIASGTFTLSWKPTGLAGATYELDYSTDGGNTWTQAYNGLNTYRDFSQLPNGTYLFRVKAMSGGASSAWATTGSYTVTQVLSAPGVPVATSGSSISSGTFTLTWRPTGLAGATYELDYSTDGGTTWILAYNGVNSYCDFSQLPSGNYIFRVKAMNGGASSGWVTTSSYTVAQALSAPGMPVATSAGLISSGTFTLTWRPTGLAGSTYELDYSPDGGTTWVQAYNGANTYRDFFQFPNGTYLFRVKAMNGGASSAWVTTGSYTVTQFLSNPGVPVATSAATISSGTFTLTWRPTGLAGSTYELDYSADGGATWIPYYSGANTYRGFSKLSNGTYMFRVKAMNGGASSGWATTTSYTVTGS